MNPSTSQQSNLHDPIKRLPREVFIQFFSSRDCKFILDSSTVSREWKDVLLSSPTLYENLELYFEDEDPGEENNLAQHAIANKTIKRILGYANLSNNRLKSVDLCFSPFAHDVRNAYSNWNATRSSVLFNILSWSSSTLTSLKLEFTTHSEELNSAILHTATIVKNLGCLRSLQKVEIQSDLAVRLKSSSPFREILVVDQYGTRDWNDEEVDEVHGSTLAILLRQITDFTGLGIKTAVLGQDYRVSSEALEELEKSKDSLLDLSLKLEVGNVLSISKFQLALKCPNLKSLVLEMWSQERETSGESLRLEVPKDKEYPNKLKSLVINNLTEAALILGEKFCRTLYWKFYQSSKRILILILHR